LYYNLILFGVLVPLNHSGIYKKSLGIGCKVYFIYKSSSLIIYESRFLDLWNILVIPEFTFVGIP